MREAFITVKLKPNKKHLLDICYFQLSKLTARRLVVQMRSAKKTSVLPCVSVILVTRVMDSTVQVRSGPVQYMLQILLKLINNS